mgnify:CR=1 FL=1
MDGAILPAGPVLVAEQLADASPIKPVALDYVSAFEKANGANSRTQFGAHAHDALKVLQRIVPVALKKARPGTPDALTTRTDTSSGGTVRRSRDMCSRASGMRGL